MFNAQPGSIFRLATGNSEQNKVTLQLNSPLEVSWDQFRLTDSTINLISPVRRMSVVATITPGPLPYGSIDHVHWTPRCCKPCSEET